MIDISILFDLKMAAPSLLYDVPILCPPTSFHSHWHYLSSAHFHLLPQSLQVPPWSSCLHSKPLQAFPGYACVLCRPGHVTPLLKTHQWPLIVFRYLLAINTYLPVSLSPMGDKNEHETQPLPKHDNKSLGHLVLISSSTLISSTPPSILHPHSHVYSRSSTFAHVGLTA